MTLARQYFIFFVHRHSETYAIMSTMHCTLLGIKASIHTASRISRVPRRVASFVGLGLVGLKLGSAS